PSRALHARRPRSFFPSRQDMPLRSVVSGRIVIQSVQQRQGGGGMKLVLEGIPAAVLLFVGLALWDTWVRRRRGEREQHPLPWLGLFALLVVLEPLEKVTGLLPGGVIGALLWAALSHAA